MQGRDEQHQTYHTLTAYSMMKNINAHKHSTPHVKYIIQTYPNVDNHYRCQWHKVCSPVRSFHVFFPYLFVLIFPKLKQMAPDYSIWYYIIVHASTSYHHESHQFSQSCSQFYPLINTRFFPLLEHQWNFNKKRACTISVHQTHWIISLLSIVYSNTISSLSHSFVQH